MVVCARPRLVSWAKVCVIIVVGLMVACPTIIAVCAVFPAASPGLGALADACFWGAAGGLCVLVLLGVWVFVFTPGSVSRVIGLVRAGVWWVVSERYRARVRHELASADARRVWVRVIIMRTLGGRWSCGLRGCVACRRGRLVLR